MSLSQQSIATRSAVNGALLEKVITSNDLAGLSPLEKVSHIKQVCESLGLNPLTKPIQLIKFQGKETMYVTKDATEQLRKNNKVSITKIENQMMDGIYIVTAHATTPDGRTDASTGAINIKGLVGENLCNAMLKAETKAKRRVTLSICGLGFIDECEADSIPGAKKIDVHREVEVTPSSPLLTFEEEMDIEEAILCISQCANLDELEKSFKSSYKVLVAKKDKESLNKLIAAKNKRKDDLALEQAKDFFGEDINVETGEVVS